MKTERFQLPTADRNVGTVYLPDALAGRLPVTLYCHGWQGDQRLNPPVADLCAALLGHSAALVTFDFFGCGETGGSYSEMTYGRWTANLQAVFDWVTAQAWADPQKIGCFAISSGTTAALRFAEQSTSPAYVVSIATALGHFIGMPHGPARVLVENFDALVAGGTADVFGVPFPLGFFTDFLGHAPVYKLASIACPVLFLQGTDDNPWRRSDAWIGYQVLSRTSASVKYVEIDGGKHGLDNVPDRCVREVTDWLQAIGILSKPSA